MKRWFLTCALIGVALVSAIGASTVASFSTVKLVDEINAALANTTNTTLTVTGKSTLSGELEVNGSDIDVNMTLTGNEIDIAQTNTTGTASVPLININDDRTGATANEASEATVYIDADGSYGLTVADGIVQIEGEIDTASGDILLDPAGGEVHVDGGVHVGGTDAVGDNNLKVDGTAEFVGATTLAAHDIAVGELPAMTDGQVLLGDTSDSNANVIATTGVTFDRGGTGAVDAAYLTAGTVATAIDISATTNANGANIASGNIAIARITNALVDAIGPDEMEDADHGDVSWATSVATVDNVAAGNISGNIAEARITNALSTAGPTIGGNIPVAAISNATAGGTGYSIPAVVIDSGNIAQARITNALATAGPSMGGNIPIAALTNAMPTMAEYAVNDLGNGTNIAAGNIASGDVASDRMTANAVVVGDFAADRNVLVGTGAGTFESVLGFSTNITITSATQTSVWYITGGIVTNIVVNP